MKLQIYKIRLSEKFITVMNIRDLYYFAININKDSYLVLGEDTTETFDYLTVMNSDVVDKKLFANVSDESESQHKALNNSILDIVGEKPKITIEF